MAITELVADYRNAALTHGSATEAGNHELANEAYDQIARLYRLIRAQGPQAAKRLLVLLNDAEPAVRLWSASHGLEIAPEQAEPVLVQLSTSDDPLLGFSAQMTLNEWKKGRLRFP